MDHGRAAPTVLRRIGLLTQGCLARGPRWLLRSYLLVLSWVSRHLLSPLNQQRVCNSMQASDWPAMSFGPRRVVLGRRTEVRLVPHMGEFDEQALFRDRLDHEPAMFDWLERHVADYDVIVEIGANVGVYTVFFDAIARKLPKTERPRIVSFEPSPEAYRRLRRNLEANEASQPLAFQAAVGAAWGFEAFHEPQGHLTNGSLLSGFAGRYSPTVAETTALVVPASALERWLAPARKALIKIDVEGYEAPLLAALAPLMEKYRPDLVIEILPVTVEALAADKLLSGYDLFLVTAAGLQPEPALYFSPKYFDWFLRPSAPASGDHAREQRVG